METYENKIMVSKIKSVDFYVEKATVHIEALEENDDKIKTLKRKYQNNKTTALELAYNTQAVQANSFLLIFQKALEEIVGALEQVKTLLNNDKRDVYNRATTLQKIDETYKAIEALKVRGAVRLNFDLIKA